MKKAYVIVLVLVGLVAIIFVGRTVARYSMNPQKTVSNVLDFFFENMEKTQLSRRDTEFVSRTLDARPSEDELPFGPGASTWEQYTIDGSNKVGDISSVGVTVQAKNAELGSFPVQILYLLEQRWGLWGPYLAITHFEIENLGELTQQMQQKAEVAQ